MTIGMSLFLIAAGAILKYAITADVEGVDIEVVGTILMIVGILGLILSLLYEFLWSERARARGGPPPPPHDAPTRRDRY